MKNIIKSTNIMKVATLFLATIIVLTFSACGGGGGDASFENSQSIINIDVNCTTPATISTYITLQSGDTIVKDDSNTSISIYHDANSTKKVCLVSGSAHIIR